MGRVKGGGLLAAGQSAVDGRTNGEKRGERFHDKSTTESITVTRGS